jgi:hypothetical protein
MINKKDMELQQESVDFSAKYIEKNFKNANMVKKNLVLNTIAHGYYMGKRHSENLETGEKKSILQFLPWLKKQRNLTEKELVSESNGAAREYLSVKQMNGLPMEEKSLIFSSIVKGFQEGVKANESST